MPLTMPSSVTNERAGELLVPLRAAVQEGALQIDAAALTDFDSAALALLLEGRRMAIAAGVPFAVRGAPAQLVELARLYGVDGVLSLT
jgi:phospholipid transport system transporter-binding protein